ncbi:MAG: YdcH family protein [Alphaproteobacteria bacterium]|nr:YdcH family protein [Alphaproteobacteria bacterium]
MLSDRLESLRARHQHLEQELDQETARPLPNPATIKDLKRRKLALKDEMNRLSAAS